jgi:hypothetical protein
VSCLIQIRLIRPIQPRLIGRVQIRLIYPTLNVVAFWESACRQNASKKCEMGTREVHFIGVTLAALPLSVRSPANIIA